MSNNNNNNKERIGNYEFIKTIGEGTFGKVKLAIHLPTQEYVAIKILEKSRINDKEELERVEKEIKYLKILNHPNIIQIYEVISNEYNYYIVMEYVSGGELFTYIVNHEKLDEKEASFFFTQLIYGIKEIHRNKICHRDIKPENLLLTEKKIIKIIDFGLSNEYIDVLDSQCGSPCYAAPEMIRGMNYDGLMVDLWACGIILYAMLCGYLPFDDKDNIIVFRKILQCKLEFPSEDETILSNDAKDLIIRILTPNPLNRIKIEEILRHPFLKSGIQEYRNMSPTIFNQEKIIIDYMVNKLKYNNKDNLNRINCNYETFCLISKIVIYCLGFLLKSIGNNFLSIILYYSFLFINNLIIYVNLYISLCILL
jgi:5'-AMP-activated protein kinase catalytic alpha subunit